MKPGDKVWVHFGFEYHKGKLLSKHGNKWLVRVGGFLKLGIHEYLETDIYLR